MIPYMTAGTDHEPIHWILKSHVQTGNEHEYEFYAPSKFEGYRYALKAIVNPHGEVLSFSVIS